MLLYYITWWCIHWCLYNRLLHMDSQILWELNRLLLFPSYHVTELCHLSVGLNLMIWQLRSHCYTSLVAHGLSLD